MPISETSCTFFLCEMNKINEYLMFENDNKKPASLYIFFTISQQTLTMLQRQKYQYRVLDAFMILYLKLYNYYNQETIKT